MAHIWNKTDEGWRDSGGRIHHTYHCENCSMFDADVEIPDVEKRFWIYMSGKDPVFATCNEIAVHRVLAE